MTKCFNLHLPFKHYLQLTKEPFANQTLIIGSYFLILFMIPEFNGKANLQPLIRWPPIFFEIY